MEVEELISSVLRNRDGAVEASKAFLKGSIDRQAYIAELEGFRRRQSEALARLLEAARQMNPVARARLLTRVAVDSRLAVIAQAVRARLDGEWGRWAALVLEERFSAAAAIGAPDAGAAQPAEPKKEEAPPAPAPVAEPPLASPTPEEGRVEAPEPASPAEEAEERAVQRSGPAEAAPSVRLDREGVKAAVAKALGAVASRRPSAVAVHRELDELLGLVDLSPLERELLYLARLLLYYVMGEVDLETARELGEEYGSRVRELSARGQEVRERLAAAVAEAARIAAEREEVRDLANLALLAAGAAPAGEGARVWAPSRS